MRCDSCHRFVNQPYAHAEYNCEAWPDMRLNSLVTEYIGYMVMYVGGDNPYEVYRGDVKLSAESSDAAAYMFIERNEEWIIT